MVLRTVTVPNPAIGTDWSSTVPGKYLYDLTGITATLTTPNTFPPLVDSSGNGITMQNFPITGQDSSLMYGYPGAIPGDTALRSYFIPATGSNTGFGRSTPSAMAWNVDFSIECWFRSAGIATTCVPFGVATPGPAFLQAEIATNGTMRIRRAPPDAYNTATGAVLFDDTWHHYVWVFPFAGAVTFWRDGVQVPTTVQTPVGLRGAVPAADIASSIATGAHATFFEDECAIYPVALTGVQVAVHYAARASFATYSAAVLADAPSMYYHLDESNSGGGRQVALEVTDGVSIVELVPTGFEVAATGNTFTYSWQPRLQARAEAADFTTITVPCPELILPAGYTVGTLTPELRAGDQWSNILLWWDDALQTATQQADAYQYAPGAHLVYQQVKGGP